MFNKRSKASKVYFHESIRTAHTIKINNIIETCKSKFNLSDENYNLIINRNSSKWIEPKKFKDMIDSKALDMLRKKIKNIFHNSPFS